MAKGIRAIQQEVGEGLISHKCKTSDPLSIDSFGPVLSAAKNRPNLDASVLHDKTYSRLQWRNQCFHSGKINGFLSDPGIPGPIYGSGLPLTHYVRDVLQT